MNIALFTDERGMANVLSYYFHGIPFSIYSRHELNSTKEICCTHIILGVKNLEREDLIRLNFAISLGIETYLMIRDPITISETYQARDIGVKGILIDPIFRLVGNKPNTPEKLFSILMYPEITEVMDEIPGLIYLGSDTYFHSKQYWVKYGDIKTDLTEKEAALLLFFLEHEGRIITKFTLAEQLWGGFIQPNGIPKVITRLKNKLGPARELILSRKLGGFLYLRNK